MPQFRLASMNIWIGCLALVVSTSFLQDPEEVAKETPAQQKTEAAKAADEEQELLPSASQVIEKYVLAMGGYEVLASVQSAHLVFKGTSSNGHTIESVYYQTRGQYVCHMQRNGLSITRGVWTDGELNEDGSRAGFAWQRVNDGILTQKMGHELQEYLRRRSRVVSSPYWQDDFKSIKCVGKTEVRGIPTWQLRFVDQDGSEIDRYFDAETGYLLRRKTMESFDGETHEVTRDYMDHEKKGDYVIAMRQTISHADIVEQWNVDSFEYDGEVPEDAFEIPEAIQNQIDELKRKKAAANESATGE